MSNKKKLKPIAPSLVMRFTNQSIETKEWSALTAFQYGKALPKHYYVLLDVGNILQLAGSSDPARQYATDFVQHEISPVMLSIRERFHKTGKLGCTGAELKALRKMVDFANEFWKRQPGELYAITLQQYDKWLEANKEAAA